MNGKFWLVNGGKKLQTWLLSYYNFNSLKSLNSLKNLSVRFVFNNKTKWYKNNLVLGKMTHAFTMGKKFFRRGLQKVLFAEDVVQTLLLQLDEGQHTLHHIWKIDRP